MFLSIECTCKELELRGDDYIEERLQNYLGEGHNVPLTFSNFSDEEKYFDKLISFLTKKEIYYTMSCIPKDGLLRNMFTSILVKKEDVQSYLESVNCNDFATFLEQCHKEKKVDLESEESKSIVSNFKSSVEDHVLSNVRQDFKITVTSTEERVIKHYLVTCNVHHTSERTLSRIEIVIPQAALN